MCIFRKAFEWFRRRTFPSSTDSIRHVVVLMLENHSFDQMLGAFQAVFPDLEGVDPAKLRSNRDKDGIAYT